MARALAALALAALAAGWWLSRRPGALVATSPPNSTGYAGYVSPPEWVLLAPSEFDSWYSDYAPMIETPSDLPASQGSCPALGARLNNPLNIRDAGNAWVGMVGSVNGFVEFSDPVYGYRAGAVLLRNYQRFYGIDTVRGLVSRWAPPVENPTSLYVDFVADAVGIAPDLPFNLDAVLPDLLAAMSRFETGCEPNRQTIQEGISLA